MSAPPELRIYGSGFTSESPSLLLTYMCQANVRTVELKESIFMEKRTGYFLKYTFVLLQNAVTRNWFPCPKNCENGY
jgi:hypothetical protein